MHITLVNAKDRYEYVGRGVLAVSFQDIVSEELLFVQCGCPEMLANQMLSFALYAGGWGGGRRGAAHLKKFSHPASHFKEQSPFRCVGAQKSIQSHPLWIIWYEPALSDICLQSLFLKNEFWFDTISCLKRKGVSGNPELVSSL